jgi:hypothetical protein
MSTTGGQGCERYSRPGGSEPHFLYLEVPLVLPAQLANVLRFPASVLEQTMREVERIHAENNVGFELCYHGPYGRERADLTCINMDDDILVYRKVISR